MDFDPFAADYEKAKQQTKKGNYDVDLGGLMKPTPAFGTGPTPGFGTTGPTPGFNATGPTPGFSTGPTLNPTPSFSTGPTLNPTPGFSTGPTLNPTPSFSTGPTLNPTPSFSTGPNLNPTPSFGTGSTLNTGPTLNTVNTGPAFGTGTTLNNAAPVVAKYSLNSESVTNLPTAPDTSSNFANFANFSAPPPPNNNTLPQMPSLFALQSTPLTPSQPSAFVPIQFTQQPPPPSFSFQPTGFKDPFEQDLKNSKPKELNGPPSLPAKSQSSSNQPIIQPPPPVVKPVPSTPQISSINLNPPPSANVTPITPSSPSPDSKEQAQEEMKSCFEKLEKGDFVGALSHVEKSISIFNSMQPKQFQKEIKICVNYKLLLQLLLEIKLCESNQQKSSYLTCLLAEIPVKVEHQIICIRKAIKTNFEASNYGTTARLIQKLLNGKIKDRAVMEEKLAICENYKGVDNNPMILSCPACSTNTSFGNIQCNNCKSKLQFDYKTFLGLNMPAFVECTFCDAIFAKNSVSVKEKCPLCFSPSLVEGTIPVVKITPILPPPKLPSQTTLPINPPPTQATQPINSPTAMPQIALPPKPVPSVPPKFEISLPAPPSNPSSSPVDSSKGAPSLPPKLPPKGSGNTKPATPQLPEDPFAQFISSPAESPPKVETPAKSIPPVPPKTEIPSKPIPSVPPKVEAPAKLIPPVPPKVEAPSKPIPSVPPKNELPLPPKVPPKEPKQPELPPNLLLNSISETEKSMYMKEFDLADENQDGFVDGDEAKQYFSKFNLPAKSFSQIWKICEEDGDSKLNQHEFMNALHFIYCALSGMNLPETLPAELKQTPEVTSVPKSLPVPPKPAANSELPPPLPDLPPGRGNLAPPPLTSKPNVVAPSLTAPPPLPSKDHPIRSTQPSIPPPLSIIPPNLPVPSNPTPPTPNVPPPLPSKPPATEQQPSLPKQLPEPTEKVVEKPPERPEKAEKRKPFLSLRTEKKKPTEPTEEKKPPTLIAAPPIEVKKPEEPKPVAPPVLEAPPSLVTPPMLSNKIERNPDFNSLRSTRARSTSYPNNPVASEQPAFAPQPTAPISMPPPALVPPPIQNISSALQAADQVPLPAPVTHRKPLAPLSSQGPVLAVDEQRSYEVVVCGSPVPPKDYLAEVPSDVAQAANFLKKFLVDKNYTESYNFLASSLKAQVPLNQLTELGTYYSNLGGLWYCTALMRTQEPASVILIPLYFKGDVYHQAKFWIIENQIAGLELSTLEEEKFKNEGPFETFVISQPKRVIRKDGRAKDIHSPQEELAAILDPNVPIGIQPGPMKKFKASLNNRLEFRDKKPSLSRKERDGKKYYVWSEISNEVEMKKAQPDAYCKEYYLPKDSFFPFCHLLDELGERLGNEYYVELQEGELELYSVFQSKKKSARSPVLKKTPPAIEHFYIAVPVPPKLASQEIQIDRIEADPSGFLSSDNRGYIITFNPGKSSRFSVEVNWHLSYRPLTLKPKYEGEEFIRESIPITELERKLALKPTTDVDFKDVHFQEFCAHNSLVKGIYDLNETVIPFVYRVYTFIAIKYELQVPSEDFKASQVVRSGRGDSAGLSRFFVAILRNSGIPARILYGRLPDSQVGYAFAQFYSEEAQAWIPIDLSSQVKPHNQRLDPQKPETFMAGFGRLPQTPLIVLALDNRLIDSPVYGPRHLNTYDFTISFDHKKLNSTWHVTPE